MKWTKVDQRTGEPMKRSCNQFQPHDHVSGIFKIINNSWMVRRQGWILQANGKEIGRFDTLKQAKEKAEEIGESAN